MNVRPSEDEPGRLSAHFEVDESAVILEAFKEHVRDEIDNGNVPDMFYVRVMSGVRNLRGMNMHAPPKRFEEVEETLIGFARRTKAEAEKIDGPTPEPDLRLRARQRCDEGDQGLTMALELGGARLAHTSDFYPQLGMFLDVEGLSAGYIELE